MLPIWKTELFFSKQKLHQQIKQDNMNQPKQNLASTKWAMTAVRATLFLTLMCILVPAKTNPI